MMFEREYKRFKEFLDWWSLQLADIFVSYKQPVKKWEVLFLATGQGIEIFKNKASSIVKVGRIGSQADQKALKEIKKHLPKQSDDGNIVLRLTRAQVLEKQIQLPKAAEDVLEPVIKNQMQKVVPWPENEVRFGYVANTKEANESDQIKVNIYATSQNVIDGALGVVKQLNVHPHYVEFGESPHVEPGIELFSYAKGAMDQKAAKMREKLSNAFMLCMLVCSLGFFLMFSASLQHGRFEQELTELKQKVNRAKRLSAQSVRNYEESIFLIRKKQIDSPVVKLLDTLTKALPDTSYATRLEVKGQQVIIYGKAKDAASLISQLEKMPLLHKVRFSAPTVRNPADNTEEFSITAEVKPGKASI